MEPRALPDTQELAQRRARRAERRRQQQAVPAPWPPPGIGLPDDETLERESRATKIGFAIAGILTRTSGRGGQPLLSATFGGVGTSNALSLKESGWNAADFAITRYLRPRVPALRPDWLRLALRLRVP